MHGTARKRYAASWGAALILAATMAGCAPQSTAEFDSSSVLIDVRTPEEFAGGHLEGAENMDAQAADFATQVEALDADESYVVYCQSGNRSARATAVMEDAGLTVQDAGGIDDAKESLDLDIVQ